MAHSAVTSLPIVGRKPGKPKKGETSYRMHIVLPANLIHEVDEVIEQIKAADPLRTDVTRTYAIAKLLMEAIEARKQK